MTKNKLIARLLSRATKVELDESIVDDLILLLAKMSDEFSYAAQKVAEVDPLIPSSVLKWVTNWIKKEEQTFVETLGSVIVFLEQKGYEINITPGYINIYGPKFPYVVFDPVDEAILRGLGFRLRVRPDKAKGNRCKWWITREEYTRPAEKKDLTDEEIHRLYG